MPIAGGLRGRLAPGTRLRARHKGREYTAEVIAGPDATPAYRLADGREFRSPSAAGRAITGSACNGWRFWSLAEEVGSVAPPKAAARRAGTKAAKAKAGKQRAARAKPARTPDEAGPSARA